MNNPLGTKAENLFLYKEESLKKIITEKPEFEEWKRQKGWIEREVQKWMGKGRKKNFWWNSAREAKMNSR